MSKNGDWLSSFDETPPTSCHMITRSMFPPSPQEAEDYQLQRWYEDLSLSPSTLSYSLSVLESYLIFRTLEDFLLPCYARRLCCRGN